MKILLADFGTQFDLQTPYYEPLGGSESSLLLLSKGLVDLGHQVVILTTSTKEQEQDSNRIRHHINFFDQYAELSDIIILNRNIPQSIMNFIDRKKIFYYSHDAYDQQNVQWMMNQKSVNLLDSILCVSEWQKQTFIKYLNVDESKLKVIGNPIDLSLYNGFTERDENRFVFASIPYKGENLANLFNDICIASKKELNLHVFSSFAMYGNKQEDKQYEQMFRDLENTKGVYLHDSVSMKDLAYEFAKSSYILFPNTYHETFSMACTQAQAAGCIPISTNCGAMNERIIDGIDGILTEGINIQNSNTYNEFVNKTVEVLNKEYGTNYKMRLNCQKTAQNYDYIKIAQKVEKLFE